MATNLHAPTPAAPLNLDVERAVEQWCQFMHGLHTAKTAQSRPWAEVQVTLPQLRALGLLAAHPNGMSGRDLAARLGVGPSAVTPLVDRLVEHKLVRREEDRTDRRITRLLATDDGLALMERMIAGQRDLIVGILRRLGPEELQTVSEAFGLLRQGLQRAAESPAITVPAALAGTPRAQSI
jgi:DNA-binding MarR family transcriptional regulator